MIVAQILVFTVGALLALSTLLSSVRTVVVPRGERVILTKALFFVMGRMFGFFSRRCKTYPARDAVLARFAPTTLMVLPLIWAIGVIVGFGYMFWGLGVRPMRAAFELSGSSITTLGFITADSYRVLIFAVMEGLIGLGIVALLIGFLPNMLSTYRERETLCTLWSIRAGSPPEVGAAMQRFHEVGCLHEMAETWQQWERWFVEVEESHLNYPWLVFFRSPTPYQSWITTAGNVLDTAAFMEAALETGPEPERQLCLRSGFLALRRIADYYNIEYDHDPAPGAPVSIPRAEFDELWEELSAAGLPLIDDREQAWRDFAGWRVNYDVPLRFLCELSAAPYAKWSSDMHHDDTPGFQPIGRARSRLGRNRLGRFRLKWWSGKRDMPQLRPPG